MRFAEAVREDESSDDQAPVNARIRAARDCILHSSGGKAMSRRLRWHAELRGQQISRYWSDTRAIHPDCLKREIHLTEVLERPEMGGVLGMTLSVFLAHSLFYLLDEEWSPLVWSRENITFFADGDRIPLRPFLKLLPRDTAAGDDEADILGINPSFIMLAVVLLEIYFRRSLQSLCSDPELHTVDDYLGAASQVFETKELQINQSGLRRAIKTCLQPQFSSLDSQSPAAGGSLRRILFESIIQPMEDDLRTAYGECISVASLDRETPQKIRIAMNTSSSHLTEPSPKRWPHKPNRAALRSPMTHLQKTLRSPEDPKKFTLFHLDSGEVDMPSARYAASITMQTGELMLTAHTRTTDDWMQRFLDILDEHDELLATSRRLKVAVIDTGVDLNHSDFVGNERIMRAESKSWINMTGIADSCGHGTHICSTIMSLTKNVDLYIAKISESETLQAEHVTHIAEVSTTCFSHFVSTK